MNIFFLIGLIVKMSLSSAGEVPLLIGTGQMPAIAGDAKENIHLAYGSGDSLLYSQSTDNGKTFSTPQLIKVIGGLAASATRGPQVAMTKDGPEVIASTEAGNIWSFRKNRTGGWDKGVQLNDVDSVNLEGFVDVASDNGNKLFAAWLDLRSTRRNKIYGARSSDGGKTWSRNVKVYESPDSTVCECCRLSVAMNNNKVYVMFRNQLYGYRDLHISTSTDAGHSFSQPKKLGTGTWKLNGCPMDGGALTITQAGKLHTVWRRESRIYSCQPGQPEVEIGQGKGCTIVGTNGKDIFAWVNNGEIICRLPDGSAENLGKGNSPVLLAAGNDKVICVWESDNHIYLSTLKV